MQSIKVFVKNVSPTAITLPEIGGYELSPGEEVDLTDESLELGYYSEGYAAIRALTTLPDTVLYKKNQDGKITYRIEEKEIDRA